MVSKQSQLYYGKLAFEPNLIFAVNQNGKKIKFSKQERALIGAFINRPNQLLSRAALLDAILEAELETLDRNVDYLISRLRRKLGDSAQHPRYIATQYGEGYLWIAKPQSPPVANKQSIYLSVGPIFGLSNLETQKRDAEAFTDQLLASLKKSFGHKRRIERLSTNSLAEDPGPRLAHQLARYSLELSFLPKRDKLACSMVVLDKKTGQIFGTFRCDYTSEAKQTAGDQPFKQLADAIRDKVWGALIFRSVEQNSSANQPLVIGLYEASKLFEPDTKNHHQIELKLRECLLHKPDDAHTAIMLAANLHTQILDGVTENPEEKLPEIESLIFDHLPQIQNDPLYLAFAAEQLYLFGHRELGKSMAQRAIDIGPSFAACFMVMGRIYVTQGQFEEGISHYEYCQGMTEKNSTFYKFLHTMKCIAYKAKGDRKRTNALLPYMIESEPEPYKKMMLTMFFAAGDSQFDLERTKAFVAALPTAAISKALKLTHYGIIRAFCEQSHRENLLRDAIHLILETHGQKAIPDAIQESIPGLFHAQKARCTNT